MDTRDQRRPWFCLNLARLDGTTEDKVSTTRFQSDGRKRKEIVQVNGKKLMIGTRRSRLSLGGEGGSSRSPGSVPLVEFTGGESGLHSGISASLGGEEEGLSNVMNGVWVSAPSEVRAGVRTWSGVSRIVEVAG